MNYNNNKLRKTTFRSKYIRIDNEKYTKDEIDNMDYDQLCTLIIKIESAIASCEDNERSIAIDYPKDSELYRQKIANCRIAIRRLREGMLWASIARKKLKNKLFLDELYEFRETAREFLDKDRFDKIMSRTRAKIELAYEAEGVIA